MNLIVNKDWTLSFEPESDETLNANDVLWHRLNVRFDDTIRPTSSEDVMALFQDDKTTPNLISRETLLLESDKGTWSALIPQDVIKVPITWYVQILIRRYDTIDPTRYVQKASNDFVSFTVENGAVLADGSPVTLATVKALNDSTLKNAEDAVNAKHEAIEAASAAATSASNAAVFAENALFHSFDSEECALLAEYTAQTVLTVRDEMQDSLSQIFENSAHIQNLYSIARENGQFAVLETEQAYTTRQTANGAEIFDEQYSPVLEIKGSTVQTINLIPYPYGFTTYTVNGITYTAQNDGSVKVTGTATGTAIRNLNTTTCRTNIASLNGAATTGGGFTISGGKDGVVVAINESDGMAYMYVEKNETVDTVIYPMLVKGVYTSETMPSYISYFSDLKHAYIKAIKSTGRNLLNIDGGADGDRLSKNNDGSYTLTYGSGVNDRFTSWFPVDIKAGTYYYQAQVIKESIKNPVDEGGVSLQVIFADGTSKNVVFWDSIVWTFVFEKDIVSMRLYLQQETENWAGKYKTFKLWLSYVSSNNNIEPYTEELYELPQELIDLYPDGIPEYDRFNPQTGEIVIQTGYATSETGFTEEEIAGYDSAIVSSDNRSLEYKLATPTIEKIENAQKLYKAWNKGSETVVQGETDNSIYGAMPTITNEYFAAVGAEEEANE